MPGKTKYPILRQPDDITCGPTCLHSIYEYYSDAMPLDDVVSEVTMLRGGGTLGALLGTHALKRGYKVWIYSYNLKVFDPTWFQDKLSTSEIIDKLNAQAAVKKGTKLREAISAYTTFLEAGGEIKFEDLSSSLLSAYLVQGIPLLTGLSATYLYKAVREFGKYPVPDDVRGEPQGHFVVLTSYNPEANTVTVADPYHPESLDYGHVYHINMEHLVCAILLGVVTYDGNLVVITK
jgi:hypothetical protein